MNHYTWTYVAGEGRIVPVGLYHSSKRGHLVIYVGKNITTIDFNVLDSKEYTFFIDNELCRIKLERRGDEMYYFFEIDRTADTPMNRARWAMERKFLYQMLIALALFLAVAIGFTVFMSGRKSSGAADLEKMLATQGVETSARVTLKMDGQGPDITYHFVAKNQSYSARPTDGAKPMVLLKNGMPLESGDEFVVKYAANNPAQNRIDFDRPTDRQINLYQERAAGLYLTLHPDEAPHIARCMVKVAFEMEGVNGLAKFYFQNMSPSENPAHNQESFFRLVRSIDFQKRVKKDCWDG